MKCFGIAWMNCTFGDSFMDRVAKEAEHPALLRIVRKYYMDNRLQYVGGFIHG